MPDHNLDDFEEDLGSYLDNIDTANSEATLGHYFLTFVQDTFSTLDSNRADRMMPYLEEYVRTKKATVAIGGRIDAHMGNVLLEFKTDLESDLDDAKSQLRQYITAIWQNQGQDQRYYLVASDGVDCIVHIASIEEDDDLIPANVQLEKVDEISLDEDDTEKVFRKLDQYLLYRDDIVPTATNIVSDFGPDSPVCREGLDLIESEWAEVRDEDVEILFEEWERYLELVHGGGNHPETLFIRHTYLSTIAKLLAYLQYSDGIIPDEEELEEVITGKKFERLGIRNFIEEDFFSWISRPSTSGAEKRICRHILARLKDYDLSEIGEDVLKALYQDLVTQGERHNLGEYYTPDWLAERMVVEELEDNPESSVLDPACGSGTFLFESIQYKKENLEKDDEELLNHLFNNVVGVDIHPLAVTIARTNFLLAAGDLVRDARTGTISIPIFLSNSIMPPEDYSDAHGEVPVPVYQFEAEGVGTVFEVPRSVSQDSINDLFDGIKDYLDDTESTDEIEKETANAVLSGRVDEYDTLSDEAKDTIYNRLVKQISQLKDEGRDTIWTFILKNVYKPIYLENKEFDLVLGNPPFLSYRYISNAKYKDYVKKLIKEEYNLIRSDSSENITQMELASLMFVYAIDNYLKEDGRISFVMPRGIVSGGQHTKLRKYEGFDSHLRYLWDLEIVKPLFNNVTCVLSAKKSEGNSYPLTGLELSGTITNPEGKWEEVSQDLTITDQTYYLNEFSETSVIMDRKLDEESIKSASPYRENIQNGCNVYPRSLWFVDFDESSVSLGVNLESPPIKTSQRAINRAEGDRYEEIRMSGQVESQFLFNTITGSELTYFTTLKHPTAVIPVEISGNNYFLHDEDSARRNGYTNLANWISEAEDNYDTYKPEDSDGTALDELDRRGKLTEKQDPNANYHILQNGGGSYVCGAVVETGELDDITLDGNVIESQTNSNGDVPPIIDHKCYFYETDSREEAYYLSGFLNSPGIRDLIKDMINKGKFGGRDIHRRVWEIYIPDYNPDDPLHNKISEKAIEGEQKAEEIVPDLAEEYSSLGWIRRKQRQEMAELRSELSELCIRALEEVNPKQTTFTDTSS